MKYLYGIQTYGSERADFGVDTVDSTDYIVKEEDVPDFVSGTLPCESDFLLAYAAVPGYSAVPNSTGSWFIQALIGVIERYHKFLDLIGMLTRVNYFVAQRESQSSGQKQIPSIVSRLRRDLYFSIEAARRSGACRT